jgi:hypothetical protein
MTTRDDHRMKSFARAAIFPAAPLRLHNRDVAPKGGHIFSSPPSARVRCREKIPSPRRSVVRNAKPV